MPYAQNEPPCFGITAWHQYYYGAVRHKAMYRSIVINFIYEKRHIYNNRLPRVCIKRTISKSAGLSSGVMTCPQLGGSLKHILMKSEGK